jgi:DNA invertase Pin-like site-specific DNA recombinase
MDNGAIIGQDWFVANERCLMKRAALYLRVSTGEQTTENQRRELLAAAAYKGWEVVAEFEDAGISGAKGRDRRPGLDAMLKAASLQRKKFDVVMVWALDRLGRSVRDLVNGLHDLNLAKIDLYLHQQQIDTTTAQGALMFQIIGAFAEFERTVIKERVNAGIARVKATGQTKSGKPIGRPRTDATTETQIRALLAQKVGMLKIGKQLGVATGVVQRIAKECQAEMAG